MRESGVAANVFASNSSKNSATLVRENAIFALPCV